MNAALSHHNFQDDESLRSQLINFVNDVAVTHTQNDRLRCVSLIRRTDSFPSVLSAQDICPEPPPSYIDPRTVSGSMYVSCRLLLPDISSATPFSAPSHKLYYS
jgi:hypothetical protein